MPNIFIYNILPKLYLLFIFSISSGFQELFSLLVQSPNLLMKKQNLFWGGMSISCSGKCQVYIPWDFIMLENYQLPLMLKRDKSKLSRYIPFP